jgi:hypothetical protein
MKVSARSKTQIVSARLSAGVVNSNPIRGMDVCVLSFCDCVALCEVGDLRLLLPIQEDLRLRKRKSDQGPKTVAEQIIIIIEQECEAHRS